MVGSEKALKVSILSFLIVLTASCSLLNCDTTLYIKSNHSYGIKVGGSVNLKGLKVGKVSDIKYLPPADFLIELKIDDRIQIPRNSTYALKSMFFYENVSIEIIPSNNTKEYCITNDTLLKPDSTSTSLEDIIIDRLKTDSQLLKKVKQEILESEL